MDTNEKPAPAASAEKRHYFYPASGITILAVSQEDADKQLKAKLKKEEKDHD